MQKLNHKNLWLLGRTLIVVSIIIAVKLAVHVFGVEFLSINVLFSGIVAGNVFLMGFLLSGVMSDYKESEKIPGEIAASLSTIYTECITLFDHKKDEGAQKGMVLVLSLAEDIQHWFYRKVRTKDLLIRIRSLNHVFYEMEKSSHPPFIARLKNEMSNLNRIIIRADVIRDTSFTSSGYLIAGSVTFLLCTGLVLSKIEPFYESLFFVGVISFLMIFLLLMIDDLDNPFGYNEKYSTEDVSLYSIERVIIEIRESNNERNIQ